MTAECCPLWTEDIPAPAADKIILCDLNEHYLEVKSLSNRRPEGRSENRTDEIHRPGLVRTRAAAAAGRIFEGQPVNTPLQWAAEDMKKRTDEFF